MAMSYMEWPQDGPEVDVWNHVQTGIDLADEELSALPEDLRQLTERLGEALIEIRSQVVADDGDELLDLDDRLMLEPWVRYAADLQVASEGVRRATMALDRYLEIRPSRAARALPERARAHVREALHTFMFGFDPACIALCRAALEQVLKDLLVAKGIYTEPQLKREKPTAGALLEKAKQATLLADTYDAAKRVVDRGDTLMHRHVYDQKILKQIASDCVRDLTAAVVEALAAA
jgi:hypothetical protein